LPDGAAIRRRHPDGTTSTTDGKPKEELMFHSIRAHRLTRLFVATMFSGAILALSAGPVFAGYRIP
jgi:hypothetical protein